MDAAIYMADMYDIHTGTYDHTTAHNPLASVTLFESNDFTTDSHTERAIEVFIIEKIYDFTGMSLLEYMSLPVVMAEHVLSVVRKKRESRESVDKDLLKDFDLED